ncbi:uncharacterized protein LOC106157667 [Lingula anatina]|uniref:Uncharacterized protein LOC106157667 n=1 Tax=Lingula anatina TaxID=7574 RepID=A0A1S3HS25_LINAN|nr:uncharacterized protein LOC106157667 [Lingula anatina]|eukprot:XP_013388835.1 uncharacterized protein LOC106157667 [Lingula anatina]
MKRNHLEECGSIVSQKQRGQRVGTRLWQRRKEHIGFRNFGIFSVGDRVEPNRKLGFTVESWKVCHISGIIALAKLNVDPDNTVSVIPSYDVPFHRLLQYDTEIHRIERGKFLRAWLDKKFTLTLVASSRAGDIVGYGVIQRGAKCNIIAPLYGDSPNIIKTLLVKLISRASNGEVIDMWAPVGSEVLQELLSQNKSTLKVLYESTRMFFHRDMVVPLEKILAIASAEIMPC